MNKQQINANILCGDHRVVAAPSETSDIVASEIDGILKGFDLTTLVQLRLSDWSERNSILGSLRPQILLILQDPWIRKIFAQYEAQNIVISALDEIHMGISCDMRFESILLCEALHSETL